MGCSSTKEASVAWPPPEGEEAEPAPEKPGSKPAWAAPAAGTPRATPRGGKGSSIFFSDPDRAHDKKLANLTIDGDVTAEKQALRDLRDAIDAAVKMYAKYGEGKKRGFALTLPELAAWSQHEAFLGGEDASATIFRDVAQLTAVEKLAKEMRATVSGVDEKGKATGKPSGVGHLKQAARCVADALQVVYGYELHIRNATNAQALDQLQSCIL